MKRYCPRCFTQFERDVERCPDDTEKLVLISDEDLVGKTLDDRYAILSKLGEGGMGTVYVAEQAIIGRKVALKVLRGALVQDESSVKRFLTEARAIATLKSPHTITLHDFGVTREGQLYYTMELLEGVPLSTLIELEAPMDHARAGRLLLQACKSLQEAHDRGILHRDIKPDNIFITGSNDGEHVTVLDFGIAKLGEDSTMGTITKTGMLCGTPAYLSPEQAQGYASVPASDLYAMAIVLYEMLAGEPPFSDTTAMRVLIKHVTDTPEPVSVKNPNVEVPVSVEEFILKGLSKKPEQRYQSVRDFRAALERALEDAEACSFTASMPSLATSAAGLRVIAVSPGDATMDRGDAINPMAHTLGSSQALPVSAPPSEPPGELSGAGISSVDPVPSQLALGVEVQTRDTSTGPEMVAPVAEARGPRVWLWGGIIGGVAVAAALGIWRPWGGAGDQPTPVATAAEDSTEESSPGAGTDAAGADPDVTVTIVAAPAAAVDDPARGADAVVATAPPSLDAVSEPEEHPELVSAAPTADVAAKGEVAAAPALAGEATTNAALEARRNLLAADRRAAKKAADVAAAKKAADAAAAKKAADVAAAKKAVDAAAAKKAADAAAARPGLGFRKVTVEPKPADNPGDKPKGGLGFRKVEVEAR